MTIDKSFNLGIIAFANDGGLAVQSRRLVNMLHPSRIMVVDSSKFSKNKEQHFEWYKEYDYFVTDGFPKNYDVIKFVEGLTHVLVCENPYNFYLLKVCNERGIKTYIQTNYEFCENLNNPHLPLPTKFLMPSHWMVDDMKKRFGDRVIYLPPPVDIEEFEKVRLVNINRKGKKRFLHVVGTLAFGDRNGTVDVLNSMKYSKEDFELVITSQHPLPEKYKSSDSRVKFEIGNKENPSDLYKDFDALIFPRRYGGLSLSCNEALCCSVPVIMSDISPNNELLPSFWLIPAEKKTEINARVVIDVYGVDLEKLANKMDELSSMDLTFYKTVAFLSGLQFDCNLLKDKYKDLWI